MIGSLTKGLDARWKSAAMAIADAAIWTVSVL